MNLPRELGLRVLIPFLLQTLLSWFKSVVGSLKLMPVTWYDPYTILISFFTLNIYISQLVKSLLAKTT